MELKFTHRDEISYANWDDTKESWVRLNLDLEIVRELSIRNSLNALVRLGIFLLFLISSALAALYVFYNVHWAAAIPLLYIYYFFYGFIKPPAHFSSGKIFQQPAGTLFPFHQPYSKHPGQALLSE